MAPTDGSSKVDEEVEGFHDGNPAHDTSVSAEKRFGTAASPELSDDQLKGESGKRFAVLMSLHAAPGAIKKYGGYGEMFVSLLRDPGETWDIFPIIEGEFPADEELDLYDGLVITGSRHDAHGSEPWIEKLCTTPHRVNEKRKKILGVCFGHQVLSRSLGGSTGRNPEGWEVGLKKLIVSDALLTKPYGTGLPPVLRILEMHQDVVFKVPPGGEVLAWSDKTRIEMFSVGDHALGIQGHPEFTTEVEEEILDGLRAAGMLTEEQVTQAKGSMGEEQADSELLRHMFKTFLKPRH